MNLSVFLGTQGTGKSHIMIYTAKMLANGGKNVLVVDGTSDQGLYNFFNFNRDLETDLEKPFIREEIEIIARNPLTHKTTDYGFLSNINFDKYDAVLIEIDKIIENHLFIKPKNVFLIQNFDKVKLIRNKNLIENLQKNIKVKIIFNQVIECKLKKEYIYEFLGLGKTQAYEIPFNESDIQISYNSKMDGRLHLKKYSYDFKHTIFQIANEIIPLGKDKKLFKKLINR